MNRMDVKAGMRVGYADVNLWDYRGTVTEPNTSPNHCRVRWDRGAIVAEEWIPNLRELPAGT